MVICGEKDAGFSGDMVVVVSGGQGVGERKLSRSKRSWICGLSGDDMLGLGIFLFFSIFLLVVV